VGSFWRGFLAKNETSPTMNKTTATTPLYRARRSEAQNEDPVLQRKCYILAVF